MAAAGKDVEKLVLAKALQLVLEQKVYVSGNRAMIFKPKQSITYNFI